MEPLRPRVDAPVPTWAQSIKWPWADFAVDRHGVVRLNDQLARVVVQKAMLPEKLIREEVRHYVGLLEGASD